MSSPVVVMVLALALVLLAAVVAMVYVKGRVTRWAAADNEVVPGAGVAVPQNWFGSHDPEPRLHRRLRDSMRSILSVAEGDPLLAGPMVTAREQAIDLDRRLVACAALPEPGRSQARAKLEAAVAQVEDLAQGIIGAAASIDTPAGAGELDRLADQLALLDALRFESQWPDPTLDQE